MLAVAGIALLLLAGGIIFWAMSSRGGDANVAGGSNANPNTSASASPHPELRYNYAPQRSYSYEVEFDCLDKQRNPRTATSTMQLEAYVQKSSRFTPSFKLYSNYYGTGIGIPGNQIIVDNQMIANAQSIEVKIGNKMYPARRSSKRLSTGMLALLEFDGPDFKPIRVNPFHDYERYPMVIQRDNDGLLYMRGRINSGTDPNLGPLDERRIQGVFPTKKNRVTESYSRYNTTGAAFDRTGTFYGFMNSGKLVVPIAMFEASLPAGSIDETPLVGRNRLTEQELVDAVSENLVSVHAINPPAADGLVRGRISAEKLSPSITSGPFSFPFDGYATLKWSPQEIVEVEKKKGSLPFFLGQCKDLLFVKLPEYGNATTNTESVQRYNNFRVSMDSQVSPEKLVPGTLTEELEYADYDDSMATVQRTVSVKFPAAENDAKIKDPCSVTANQIINFDHVRGIVVDSTINGTLEYVNDGETANG